MHDFAIKFDASLQTVQVNGQSYDTGAAKAAPSNESGDAVATAEVASTIAAIELGLKQLRSELNTQQSRLQSSAVTCAIETVRILLGSNAELIEERMRANITRLMQTESKIEAVKVYVHPSCCDAVESLVMTEYVVAEGLEIFGDAQLLPGDCRVDFGQSGRIASLDSQLKLIKTRLEQSMKEQSTGSQQ